MSLADEIRAESPGALFHRADLHIHSYGEAGSYDNTDASMTPQAIVDSAITEKLDVIGITDHNAIGNVRPALQHAQGKDILVIPGVELSTSQGHLLIYAPAIEALEDFFGKLDISADRKVCHHTIPQCLELADKYECIGICAHIDTPNGLEDAVPKNNAFKQDILKRPNLLALEIADANNEAWFTSRDGDADRKNLANFRRTELELEETYEIAKVMSSDAHTIETLGRNASGNRRLTRLKMEAPTFGAFRVALLDSAARTRLEDLLPDTVPRFVGMKLEGGFLDGQVARFSKNLTCIIGGRGAGKSTMLESLRVSSGNIVANTLVDSDAWPDSISLVYQDEVGQHHVLTRAKLREVINQTNPTDGPTRIQIESYGQGETAETIQHCDKAPNVLLKFLDEFVDLQALRDRDAELRELLLQNQTELERLQLQIIQIPNTEQAKNIADQQLAVLKQQDAKKIVELEEKLANERTFREQLVEGLKDIVTSVKDGLSSESIGELLAGLDSSTLVVGKDEFAEVKKLVMQFSATIDAAAKNVTEKTSEFIVTLKEQLKQWRVKEKDIQDKIEDIRRDLEKKNVKLDMAFIRKVTKDSTDYAGKLVELRKNLPKKTTALKQRRELMTERRQIKSRAHTVRTAFATVMNKNLASTVVDYAVHLRYYEGQLSKDFEELIKNAMSWRTSQVPRAYLMASQMSPFDMLDVIAKKDTTPIRNVKDERGNPVFTQQEAGEILAAMSQQQFVLERCPSADRPEIVVTKKVTLPDGKVVYPQKDFSQLSLGQQQSVLLSIMLFSKSRVPLIIDQPEDNLDSEFIYKTVVRTLRRIKECRQVIIVTHNPNIAVLGDAELIIPLRGAADRAVIRHRGSIDNAKTKKMVCTILEGGEEAFRKRQAVYGF